MAAKAPAVMSTRLASPAVWKAAAVRDNKGVAAAVPAPTSASPRHRTPGRWGPARPEPGFEPARRGRVPPAAAAAAATGRRTRTAAAARTLRPPWSRPQRRPERQKAPAVVSPPRRAPTPREKSRRKQVPARRPQNPEGAAARGSRAAPGTCRESARRHKSTSPRYYANHNLSVRRRRGWGRERAGVRQHEEGRIGG